LYFFCQTEETIRQRVAAALSNREAAIFARACRYFAAIARLRERHADEKREGRAGGRHKKVKKVTKVTKVEAKEDYVPMNAFFYYQALRHMQVKKNGGPNAKEAERVKQLTEAQPEDKPLAPFMILSKLFNEDEYKKFDAKKKSELDATAKGFSLFRFEKYPDELEDKSLGFRVYKSKPLADWVALKEVERVAYEKRAKQIADEKRAKIDNEQLMRAVSSAIRINNVVAEAVPTLA